MLADFGEARDRVICQDKAYSADKCDEPAETSEIYHLADPLMQNNL
jgi:hypothetical protein